MKIKDLEIVQLSHGLEQANSFFIISHNHVIIIDACSKDIVQELISRSLIPDYLILTHEHVDHLWGLNRLREKFPEIKVVAQESCSVGICSSKTNKATQYHIYAVIRYGNKYVNKEAENRMYCCKPANLIFDKKMNLGWNGHTLTLFHTPGHSPGSSIVCMDNMVFSGDTILNEGVFLKLDGGDERAYSMYTLPIIETIDSETIVFPGHGEPFMKREWKG